ncbi:MAG: metallophosphoesterase [Brevibacterium sp.]|uniref:metallophosphoesterase family protein n=1 Tax=Brevibacterium sp. TaxID=1701 RepID=UPI00264A1201|nr:metallophosphoesterase [Brevibacterium sp.]MDN6132748.1 metallophosphoesterase [Brevibacterium sp.]MDN6187697.1 metallophosphoesterase [Brevibacterium sp.]MDN6191345.1 metallophosphoesterase [Brevibacterium sp.]MDN6605546.1 metallophosphoesterase [Brevibacterium sp.]MDN6667866.1 metallophosphoesterase [Brevibacterium sp.]
MMPVSARRRTSALLILMAVVAVVTLPWALFSARAELSFGPHEARYQITADSRLTVDFGPLGKLLVPADEYLPLGLGLTVDIGEIPVSGVEEDEGRAGASERRSDRDPPASASSPESVGGGAVDALGGDVASYAALFSAPQAQVDEVVDGMTTEILARWALAVCIISGAAVAMAFILGPVRLAGIGRALVGKELIGIGLVTVLVLASVGTAVLTRPTPLVADPAFEGTPLAGAQVTGRLGGVIDAAFTAVKDFSDDNDAFYDQVLANLRSQWNARPMTGNWSDQGMVPPPHGADQGVSADVSTFVFGSDLHCNIGMARVVGAVARMSDADAYIDGGDVTMTGTSAENYCLDVLDDELPEKLPRMIVKGNHDSTETTSHARTQGWKVLEDSSAQMSGVTFFGGPDPRRTVFGSGPQLETDLTADQYAQNLRTEACASDFDIMVIHDPRIGAPSLRSGCATYSLSGHWHKRVGPETLGSGVRYVSSTTGGALANALTPGPLKMDAELSILRVDNRTKRPIDVQIVTVSPDKTVTIDPWRTFPRPVPLIAQPPQTEPSTGGG